MFYGTLPPDTQDFRQVLAGIARTIRDRAAAAGQRIGQSGSEAIALQNQIFGDPNRPLRVTDENALRRYTEMIMAGPMGFAPMGMTKAVPPTGLLEQGVEKIYHGTSPQAARQIEKAGFDINKSADGTVWFTSNPQIGEVAATGKGAVVERLADLNKLKLGGWKETDKYSVDELIQQGYDGLRLVDGKEVTYQIFNPEKLRKPLK